MALKLLRLGWLYCCLAALYAIAEGPKYLLRVLLPTTVLGATLSCVFELRDETFPFWSAMQLPAACAVLLALHRMVGLNGR